MLALNALVGYLLAQKPLLAANDGFSKIKLKPAFYVIEDNLENLRWQNYLADDFVLENEPQDLTEVNSYLLSLSKEEETKENISLT